MADIAWLRGRQHRTQSLHGAAEVNTAGAGGGGVLEHASRRSRGVLEHAPYREGVYWNTPHDAAGCIGTRLTTPPGCIGTRLTTPRGGCIGSRNTAHDARRRRIGSWALGKLSRSQCASQQCKNRAAVLQTASKSRTRRLAVREGMCVTRLGSRQDRRRFGNQTMRNSDTLAKQRFTMDHSRQYK